MRRPGLGACVLLLVGAQITWSASVEEDEETNIGDVGFSIPAEVARIKRDEAAANGFSLLGGVTAFWGDDGNLFRSPEGLVKKGTTWGNWGYLRADTRWEKRRFLNTIKLSQSRFPGHGVIDADYAKSSNWFSTPLMGGLELELDADFSYQNDDATNIAGQQYTRDYSYRRLAGETVLEWRPFHRQRLRVGFEGVAKDYGETFGQPSLDWKQWTTQASYRLYLPSHQTVTTSYAFGHRRYREEPAGLVDGRELPDNPTEKHRYREWRVDYSIEPISSMEANLGYGFDSKQDLFQGYEDNRVNRWSGDVGWLVRSGVELKLAAERAWKDYRNIKADSGKDLSYRTQQLAAGARVRVTTPSWLFADVSRYERTTNNSTGSSYRDYRGTLIRGGVSAFF
ncbi:MAG: hypothetical protein R3E12_03225 [Candidatus Eisenbacteria bacterium]